MSAGYERMWEWFGLSRASWLTLPRVLIHEMPDEWQGRLADLLKEWDSTWEPGSIPDTMVRGRGVTGRMAALPGWLSRYRHPMREDVDAARREKNDA